MGLHAEAKLDKKFIEFARLMNLYLSHFPKHERHGLALEIRRSAYDVYALIVECQKRFHKKTALSSLDIRHEQLRMQIRLADELGYFDYKEGQRVKDKARAAHRYHHISAQVDELGKMIGGWVSADRAKNATREAS